MAEWALSAHAAMTAAGNDNVSKTRSCNYSLEASDDKQ
jgi:hypothetical protein